MTDDPTYLAQLERFFEGIGLPRAGNKIAMHVEPAGGHERGRPGRQHLGQGALEGNAALGQQALERGVLVFRGVGIGAEQEGLPESRVAAVAPLPMTTTRAPSTPSPSGHVWAWTYVPPKRSTPANSGR